MAFQTNWKKKVVYKANSIRGFKLIWRRNLKEALDQTYQEENKETNLLKAKFKMY